MRIPERRRREIAAKEAAREERYHDRLGDLVGLGPDSDVWKPQAPAFYSPATGIVCTACRRYAETPIRIIHDAEAACEHCGKRLDHVQHSSGSR